MQALNKSNELLFLQQLILKGASENSEPIQQLQDKRCTFYSGELQGITLWFGIQSTHFCSFPWKSFTSFCCFVSSGFQYKDLLTPTDELVDFDFRHGMRKQTGNLGEKKNLQNMYFILKGNRRNYYTLLTRKPKGTETRTQDIGFFPCSLLRTKFIVY